MQTVKLHFFGYTWENYRWQIANKKDILLVYRGKLDPEGFAVMSEILFIGNTSILDFYDSPLVNEIRKKLEPSDMLFFSYAEVDKELAIYVESLLVAKVKPRFNKLTKVAKNLIIECSGNCALLPNIIDANNNQ